MTKKSYRPSPGRDPRQGAGKPTHHDPYHARAKSAGTLQCKKCGAVCKAGLWSWRRPPPGEVRRELCPACKRTRDRYGAGTIQLLGAPGQQRDAILLRIRNVATSEQAEHPLERILAIEHGPEGTTVRTTGVHLARRIAGALGRGFPGELSIHYGLDADEIRVQWKAVGPPARAGRGRPGRSGGASRRAARRSRA